MSFADNPVKHLHCNSCGKQVSTGFIPQLTDTPDGGIIIRAHIECPECLQFKAETLKSIKIALERIDLQLKEK